MNIIENYQEKIKGQLSCFDRQLNNYRQFLFYLIQNKCDLKDFKHFIEEHTKS